MTSAEKKALKSQARGIKSKILVGKNGITEKIIDDLNELLGKEKLVKVRFVAQKEEKANMSQELAEATQSQIIDQIGHVAVYLNRKNETK